MDYEVELAIVIGETVPRRTSVADADQYILGYTVVHDVSARDWQLKRNGGQWLIGKTFDNYVSHSPLRISSRPQAHAQCATGKIETNECEYLCTESVRS